MYEAEYEYIQFGTIVNENNNNEIINDLPISSKIIIIPSNVIPIIPSHVIPVINDTTTNNNNNNLNQYNPFFIEKKCKNVFNVIIICLFVVIMINIFYSYYYLIKI